MFYWVHIFARKKSHIHLACVEHDTFYKQHKESELRVINLSSSPLVSSDADGCWQRFPHCLHKLFKLSIGHQALLFVVLLEQLVLLDNVSIASSPALNTWLVISGGS